MQEVDLVCLSLGKEPLTQSRECILFLGVRLKRIDYGRRRRRQGESSLNRNTCGGSSSRPWRSKDLANLNQSLKRLGQSQFTGKSPAATLAPSALPPVSAPYPAPVPCLLLYLTGRGGQEMGLTPLNRLKELRPNVMLPDGKGQSGFGQRIVGVCRGKFRNSALGWQGLA